MKEKIALQRIEQQLTLAKQAIWEAMSIADQNGMSFHWEPPAPLRGEGTHMGGTYYGKTHPNRKELDDFQEGWLPSNQSC
jgi:hypothetical protein